MIVVVNSTPLIYLAAIGQFDLLQRLYGRIVIPTAVFDEVVTQGAGQWGSTETAGAAWIDRRLVADRTQVDALLGRLDPGESEVIVLAEELGADLAIVDEAAARRELATRGVPFIGTVGVLAQAKEECLIVSLRAELDALRAAGFRLSEPVYRYSCRRSVNEF
jgi:predicted nucleic acid-binding protein